MRSIPTSLTSSQKGQYNEFEAAQMLGVSVQQLRTLVTRHIVAETSVGTEAPDLAAATYNRSDLVVLRVLATQLSGSLEVFQNQ